MRFPSLLSLGGLATLVSIAVADPIAYQVQTPPLTTDWTYKVGTNPWPEHPRPQLQRASWKNLNGLWTYQQASSNSSMSSPPSGQLKSQIMIPSCVESGLSGIQQLNPDFMWFRTNFTVPAGWKGDSVLLNFEAVDYEATVWVNGAQIGHNVGGYNRFTIDVTANVKIGGGQNDLLVFVRDPTDTEIIPIGKQAASPSHIFYRACSGIWQTVWLEKAPADRIQQLDVAGDMNGTLTVTAHSTGQVGAKVQVTVNGLNGLQIAKATGTADKQFKFQVPNVQLWSPDHPNLYNITVDMAGDVVHSYTGFRTISRGVVNGVQRPLLNGEFIFLFATLDQGFWPDGLYLAPNRDAMESDIKMLKNLGFNMIRKHIKYEPDLFYRSCDELGIMLMQDMPSMPADTNARPPTAADTAEWQRQYEVLINEHVSYPSIISWIIINEGWGQSRQPPWPEALLTEYTRTFDPTRLIDATTGWFDHGYGDFSDNHHYANPQCGTPFYSIQSIPYDPTRIGFQGEFGGIGEEQPIQQ